MNHLESLTEKLHALLPELLELSFGQRVRNKQFGYERVVAYTDGEVIHYCPQPGERVTHDFIDYFKEDGVVEILGHEPQLHHILKAFEKKYGRRKYAFNTGGFLLCEQQIGKDRYDRKYRFVFDEKGRNVKFDLTLPIHLQSPELHEFLDNLLPKPNEE